MHKRINLGFYNRTDVVQVAKDLLGKILVTAFDDGQTTGIITEVEAYRAPDDRACHAFGNRRTRRTEVMFREGGHAYIYLCYGIHHLFNVVTAPEGMAHAVLIRGIEPLDGVELMFRRRGLSPGRQASIPPKLSTGPGALAQAMGLHTSQSGHSLVRSDSLVWIEDRGLAIPENAMACGPRIGVESAGESAAWEWRFWLRDSRYVTRVTRPTV